jgi:hypothetical protein
MIRAILLSSLLSGCAWFGGYNYGPTPYGARPYSTGLYGAPDAEVVVRQPELYTRNEIDAINAEITCRALARNTLQAQRCGVRR